jgi:hypothetical protein
VRQTVRRMLRPTARRRPPASCSRACWREARQGSRGGVATGELFGRSDTTRKKTATTPMAMRTIRVLREIAGARARDVPCAVGSDQLDTSTAVALCTSFALYQYRGRGRGWHARGQRRDPQD